MTDTLNEAVAPDPRDIPPPPATAPRAAGRAQTGLMGTDATAALIRTATDDLTGPAQRRIEDTTRRVRDIAARRNAELGPMREAAALDAEKRRDAAFQAYEGIEPVDVQPWTQKPPTNNPLQEFGSAASIFAQLATAFTGASIENSLNAGAAAMQAIQARDSDAYEKAFQAWKFNGDLSLARHQRQHADFAAAMKMLETDAAAGEAAMKSVAAKYGDELALEFTVAGQYDKLADLMRSRQAAAVQLLQVMPNLEMMGLRSRILLEDPDYLSDDPVRMAEAVKRATEATNPRGNNESFDERNVQSLMRETPGMTRQQALEKLAQIRAGGARTEGAQRLALAKDRVAEINAARKEAGFPELTAGEQNSILNEFTVQMSGNRVDDLRQALTGYGTTLDQADNALEILRKYEAAAGAAGMVARPIEAVRNMFGDNSTEYADFRRAIEYLKFSAPRLLQGATGRPLASESDRINAIVAGTGLLDTAANTRSALTEFRDILMRNRRSIEERLGPYSSTPPSITPGAPRQSAPRPWIADPPAR